MPLHPEFPTDPYAILDPAHRWYPGDTDAFEVMRGKLIPPLVAKVRLGVTAWRHSGYAGASRTTRALLKYWFQTEHMVEIENARADKIPLVFRPARGGGKRHLAL